MVRLLRHRQTKEPETDRPHLTTAPHLDSTHLDFRDQHLAGSGFNREEWDRSAAENLPGGVTAPLYELCNSEQTSRSAAYIHCAELGIGPPANLLKNLEN